MRTLALFLVLSLVALSVRAGDVETHTGTITTAHLEVHYRPGSRAGAAAVAEQDLLWICRALDVKPMGGLNLYPYDDVPALQALTGQTGAGGFTAGDRTHVPYDDDPTRRHEMVHLVSHQLPRTGEEARSLFFNEGLANALLEYVHDVHVHAVAAFYRGKGKLPALGDLVSGDFYVWQRAHPNTNGYDIAGSFVRFLIDTYGIARIRHDTTAPPHPGGPGTEAYGNCVVRVRIKTPTPCPIQVRLGPENQAMLVNGTFLYRGDASVGFSRAAAMTPDRKTTDFVLVRKGESIEVWIDGARVLVAPAAGDPSPVGIAVHGRGASFEALRVRRLP